MYIISFVNFFSSIDDNSVKPYTQVSQCKTQDTEGIW